MEEKHKALITKNYVSLVERTSLSDLLPLLIEKNVLTQEMAEKFMDGSKLSKQAFYHKIRQRGPNAFGGLVEALYETAQWDLVRMLSPDHPVNPPNQTYRSIAESKKKENKKEVNVVLPPVTNTTIVNDFKFMSIDVKKSDKYHESQNPNMGCYYAKSKNRGVCLFFNNIDYINDLEKKREGAVVDQKNLEVLFNQIGIEFRPFVNKTKQEFEDILNGFAKSQLKGIDCVFIIVSSHGQVDSANNDFVRCCDGDKILDKDIIAKFNNTNCRKLQRIPKIFIFQKCRGEELDSGCTPAPDGVSLKNLSLSERTQLDGQESNSTMNTFSDILIVHSTMQGFASLRDTRHGSWYFIAMCNVFMEHAHNTHIMDLFAMVDKELKKIDFEKNVVQTSHITALSFNHHLFLNPGYFGD